MRLDYGHIGLYGLENWFCGEHEAELEAASDRFLASLEPDVTLQRCAASTCPTLEVA